MNTGMNQEQVVDPEVELQQELEPGTDVPVVEQPTPPTADFISRAEALALMDHQARTFQSMLDKNVSRLDGRVGEALKQSNQAIDLLKSSGMQVTEAQAQAIRNNAINAALAGPEPQQQQQQQPQIQQQPVQPELAMDPVTATANAMVQRAGITFEPNDPEIRLIKRDAGTPVEYLTSVSQAIAAKQARLAGTVSVAGAPIVLGGQGKGAGGETRESLTARLEQINANPSQANLQERRTIMEKLNKLPQQ